MKNSLKIKIFLGLTLLIFLNLQTNILCNQEIEMSYKDFAKKYSVYVPDDAYDRDWNKNELLRQLFSAIYVEKILNEEKIWAYYNALIVRFGEKKVATIDQIKEFIFSKNSEDFYPGFKLSETKEKILHNVCYEYLNRFIQINKRDQLLKSEEFFSDFKKLPAYFLIIYNYLRELTNLPKVKRLDDADYSWAKEKCFQVLYEDFKKQKEEQNIHWAIKRDRAYKDFLDNFNKYMRENNDIYDCDINSNWYLYSRLLLSYNYFKELEDKNFIPVCRDETFPEMVHEESYKELMRRQHLKEANYWQKNMVTEATNLLFSEVKDENIKKRLKKIWVFSFKTDYESIFKNAIYAGFFIRKEYIDITCSPIIALNQFESSDLFRNKAVAYHEMGHIADMFEVNNLGKFWEVRNDNNIEFWKLHDNLESLIRNNINISGTKLNSSIFKAWFYYYLSSNLNFKKSEQQKEKLKEYVADFFMLENLFKQKDLASILNNISKDSSGILELRPVPKEMLKGYGHIIPFIKKNEEYARNIYNSMISKSRFLSNLRGFSNYQNEPYEVYFICETVLFTVGFLISKGIDVNSLFRAWENTGKCLDVEEVYSSYWQDILKQTPKYVIDEQMKFAPEKFMMKN